MCGRSGSSGTRSRFPRPTRDSRCSRSTGPRTGPRTGLRASLRASSPTTLRAWSGTVPGGSGMGSVGSRSGRTAAAAAGGGGGGVAHRPGPVPGVGGVWPERAGDGAVIAAMPEVQAADAVVGGHRDRDRARGRTGTRPSGGELWGDKPLQADPRVQHLVRDWWSGTGCPRWRCCGVGSAGPRRRATRRSAAGTARR